MDTAKLTTVPRWYVESYMERRRKTLDQRRFHAMALDASIPYIYNLQRVRHDRCVGL